MHRSYQDRWSTGGPGSGALGFLTFSAVAAVVVSGFAAEPAGLFQSQYHVPDPSFCYAQGCVDFFGDGRRQLLFASRGTGELQMLDAADGTVRWSRRLAGDQQSISVFDLNGDGNFEIVYTVSGPGRLYVLDRHGTLLRQWDSGDWKLGNSPVVIDADGNGVLDGYFGTRSKYLVRLNMADLSVIARRSPWIQCGCHISAMDVDRNGRWDLFAGMWAPGPAITPQNDVSTLLSPRTYGDLVLPCDHKIVRSFPYTEFHMHSTEHHQVDQILTLERLTAVEFTLEHTVGGPPLDDMLPVARRILEHKPLILAALDLETAERCVAELPARGLCLTLATVDPRVPPPYAAWLEERCH